MQVTHKMPCSCRVVLTKYQELRDWPEKRAWFIPLIDPVCDGGGGPVMETMVLVLINPEQTSPFSRGPGTLTWISSHNNSCHWLGPSMSWHYTWIFHTLSNITSLRYISQFTEELAQKGRDLPRVVHCQVVKPVFASQSISTPKSVLSE